MAFPDQVVDTAQLICEHTLVCVSIWMKLVSSLLWNSDQWGFACPRDTANVPLNNETQHLLDWESNYHCMNSNKQMKTGKWNSIITALRPKSCLSVFSALVQSYNALSRCPFMPTEELVEGVAPHEDHVIAKSHSWSMGLMISREWPDLCWVLSSILLESCLHCGDFTSTCMLILLLPRCLAEMLS